MIREDGSEEDFSAKKCLDAVELNPPYVTPEEKPGSRSGARDGCREVIRSLEQRRGRRRTRSGWPEGAKVGLAWHQVRVG